MKRASTVAKAGRYLSAAAAVGMAAALLTSCSGATGEATNADSAEPLEIWARADADASSAYEAIFKKFTEQTGIKVNYQGLTDLDNRLQTRAASKDLPDIVINDSASLGNYSSQGFLQEIDPKSVEVNEKISKDLWDEAKAADGKTYAVPYSRQTMLTLVRKDWREKLGLAVPETLAELSQLADAFATQDPDGNGKADTYGMTVPGSTERGYMTWWASSYIWQNGGDFLTSSAPGKFASAANTSDTKASVAWVKDQFCTAGLIQPGALTASSTVSHPYFLTGKTGIELVGPYAFNVLDKELGKEKYEVIKTPKGSSGETVLAEGENIYVTASNRNPDDTQAVVDFMVSAEGQTIGMIGGVKPVVRVPVNSEVDAGKVYNDGRWSIVQDQLENSSKAFPSAINFAPFKQLIAESLNRISASCEADNIDTELSALDEAITAELESQKAKS